ncbi:MAG: hypothetical protein IPQ08_07135 [Chitinophagaceae bacterium]|nr:hypothetical protein [Chitinophagaceae bacterium]
MRSYLFLIVFSIPFLGFAQNNPVQVPATKCSMVPPPGFTLSNSFSGFQEPVSGSSIMVTEIPSDYEGIAAGFTADALKSKGMTLLNKTDVMVGKAKGVIIKASQSANGINYFKQVLFFGAGSNTVLVNAVYKEANKQQEPAIRTALLSTVYDPAQNSDPQAAAPFKVDLSGSGLKPVKFMAGSLICSADGKIPTEKPTLIVGSSVGQKVAVKDQKEFAEARLKKLPKGESLLIKNEEVISINGMAGYEIESYGLSPANKPALVYQVMLFDENGYYYIIVGQAAEDMINWLQHFKKAARSFQRK